MNPMSGFGPICFGRLFHRLRGGNRSRRLTRRSISVREFLILGLSADESTDIDSYSVCIGTADARAADETVLLGLDSVSDSFTAAIGYTRAVKNNVVWVGSSLKLLEVLNSSRNLDRVYMGI